MLRVLHFEIHADDPQRAVDFYKNVFGWTFKKWSGPMEYWIAMTGDKSSIGIDGAVTKRMEPLAKGRFNSYLCTIDVPDIDKYIEKIKENGGKVLTEKMEIPQVGMYAPCEDTEGNSFGIIQMNPDAPMM